MSNVPLFVSTDWLAERLEDPELRLLDATTFLKQPEGDGYYDVWSGKEAYEEAHIPGAVFADLKTNCRTPMRRIPSPIPPVSGLWKDQ